MTCATLKVRPRDAVLLWEDGIGRDSDNVRWALLTFVVPYVLPDFVQRRRVR